MSDSITLTLEKRELTGKKVNQLRKSGKTPGVIYGHSLEPIDVQAHQVALAKVVATAGKHHLVNLDLEGKKHQGIIKSVDIDPVKHSVRHVSFHIVNQNEKIETTIPIRLVGEGESEAEKAGLVVLQTLDSLIIRSLPKDLPDAFEVSIVGLSEAGQTVTIADIAVPKGVELAEEDTSITVANVYEPAALAAANEAAGGDATDETDVESENGSDESQEDVQADDTKQSNADANK